MRRFAAQVQVPYLAYANLYLRLLLANRGVVDRRGRVTFSKPGDIEPESSEDPM